MATACTPKHQRKGMRNLSKTFVTIACLLVVACSSSATIQPIARQTATSTTIPPTATPLPTPAPLDQAFAAAIQKYVAGMSLDDKIGQLLFAQSFSGGIYQDPTATIITKFHPGGIIVYQGELQSESQAQTYFKNIQSNSPIPILIGTDNEGGGEWRLQNIFSTNPPSAFTIGSTDNPAYAYQQGTQMAKLTLQVGMNLDFAPVVDVHPTGFDRDFSTNPSQVATMAGAWMSGLQDNGVIATMKHFPGLGNTYLDPHKGLPIDTSSAAVIEDRGLLPYRMLINSFDPPGAIMTTDILVKSIDPNAPAEISAPVITGLLRNQLNYTGVVITDALYMGGMGQYMCQIDHVSNCDPETYARNNPDVLARLGVMALLAGSDMLMGTYSVETTQAMIDAIKAAIANGQLSMARIDQSVERIITLKVRDGLMKVPGQP